MLRHTCAGAALNFSGKAPFPREMTAPKHLPDARRCHRRPRPPPLYEYKHRSTKHKNTHAGTDPHRQGLTNGIASHLDHVGRRVRRTVVQTDIHKPARSHSTHISTYVANRKLPYACGEPCAKNASLRQHCYEGPFKAHS